MNDAALALRGVTKQFPNGVIAVRDLDLRFEPGSFTSLLGPSGCGKSTALRMIAGLAQPTAGEVVLPARGGTTSFVFQEPTLMPWASALENVMLPLVIARAPRRSATDRARDALNRVGLHGFAESYPRELSGGMKMRVSLARAIVTAPQLLLLDEPFAALDEITRFKLNNDLRELWAREGFTAIFVTHSVFESVYLSQRVVVMAARPGRVTDELRIDAPGERGEPFRTSPEYVALCRRVSEALERALAA